MHLDSFTAQLTAKLQQTSRTLDGEKIDCLQCDDNPTVWHRTSVANLAKIAEAGRIALGETSVVSLSANEKHTYGGAVRIAFQRDKLPPLKPMCYAEGENQVRAATLREKLARREDISLNRAEARLGVTHIHHVSECEQMSPQPVDVDLADEIAYYVHQGTGIIEESQVSCRRRYPHSIDGTGWSGDAWEKQLERIAKVRKIARGLRIPFRVRSCFPAVRLGWWEHIGLDEDNLARLERGEEPTVTRGELPEFTEEDCRC